MASFKKLNTGKVRVFVEVNGHRTSKTLPASKAKSWAREREVELSRLTKVEDDTRVFADLFRRYSTEVSPKKRGCKWEQKRLNRFANDRLLSHVRLKDSTRKILQGWVDHRLTEVQSSTVNRELNLLSNCLTKARLWGWIAHNPFKDLERPKDPPPRNRRISNQEIEFICHAAGFQEGLALERKSHFVAIAFLFAIETAMRASEICSLDKKSVNYKTRVAHLDKTKNGDERDVPLTKRAMELLKLLPSETDKHGHIFNLTPESLDANFRKIKKKTIVENLHFHDTRHEATTRLAQLTQMNVLRLARITGHKDLKYLMIYFNETAAEMVSALDSAVEPKNNVEINDRLVTDIIKKMASQFIDTSKSTSDIRTDDSSI